MDVLLVFVLSGYFTLVLALIVGMIAVEWILFERAGEPGWKVLIPFYDSFILHKIAFGEESKWYWFLLLVPVMASTCATPSRKPMDTQLGWPSYRFSSL